MNDVKDSPANYDPIGALSGPVDSTQQSNEQSVQVAGDNSKEISHLTEPWKHSRLHQIFSPQALENMFQKPLGLYADSSMPEQQQFHTCHDPSSFLGDGDSFMIETGDEDVLPQSFTIADMDDIFAENDGSMNILAHREAAGAPAASVEPSILRTDVSSVSLTSPTPQQQLGMRQQKYTDGFSIAAEEKSFIAAIHRDPSSFDVSVLVENDDGARGSVGDGGRPSQSRSFSIMTMPDDDETGNVANAAGVVNRHNASALKESGQYRGETDADKTSESTNGSVAPSSSFHIPEHLIVESTALHNDFLSHSVAAEEGNTGHPIAAANTSLQAASINVQLEDSIKSMPDISIRKEMQRIRAEHPAVFAFSPSQIVGSAKDGCDFVDFSANFPNHRIELNLESKPSVDSFPMQRHGRPKPSPRSSATKSSVKKSLTNEKNIETLLRAEHEYSPNKLQLFQVNYDKANLIKIPVLAAELKEADYGSVSHIEDDLGVSVSIKRLKLSEKSFVSQYEDNQQLDIAKDNNNLDDKDSIINSIETVCRETQINDPDDSVANDTRSLSRILAVVDDACNTDSSTPIDKSHVDRGINAEKACSIQSSPCNLHTAPSTDSTVTEVEEKVASIQLDGSGRELVESAVDQAAQDISRVSLRTEDQTTISHCSSPSFLSNFDAEASLLNHVSFLQSKDEYAKKRCRKNISAYRAERPPSDLASAVNNAVEEEEAFRNSTRSPEADLSFEGDPANSTEYLAIQVENAHYDITTNTVANTTRFAALEHAFDGLLDAAEGPSMVLRREVSLYIQSQMIDEANILNEEQTDRTLDAKRLLRDSLPAAELQSTNCASLDISAGAPMTLTFVSLRNNNLNDMTIFEHLPNLHHLDISFNKLISLKALSGLKHLRELHVDGNLLESLHGIDACGGLVKVSAVNNRIKISEPEIWHGLGQLEFLDLTGNCLTDLAGLDRLANLVVLRAGDNKISNLAIATEMCSLQQIWLNGNRLCDFNTLQFPSVTLLNLDYNPLKTDFSPAEQAKNISSVKELGLRRLHNSDAQLDINFRQFHDCTFIALSGNLLRCLNPLMGYYCLEYLDVSGCHLRSLPANMVSGMPNLRVLDLSHNSLSSIAPLRKLKRLRRVYLLDNDLKSITECLTALTSLRKLQVLDLRQNPITANFYPTVSSIGQYVFKRSSVDSPTEWAASVDRFLLDLNDAAFVRRLCYKSTTIHKLSNTLHTLDGLMITEKERTVAEEQYQKLKNNFGGYASAAASHQTSPMSSPLQFAPHDPKKSKNNSNINIQSEIPLFSVPPFPRQDSDGSKRSPLMSRYRHSNTISTSASSLAMNISNVTNNPSIGRCENIPRYSYSAALHQQTTTPNVKPSVSFWIPVEKKSVKSLSNNGGDLCTAATSGNFAHNSTWQHQQQQQQRTAIKNPQKPIIKPSKMGAAASATIQGNNRRRYCVYGDDGRPLLLTRDIDPSSRSVWG